MKSFSTRVLAVLFFNVSLLLRAATLTFQPVADTTLTEGNPDNNLGGTSFVNAGTTGMNAHAARNRGLYRFDFSSIPANTKILNATLTLEVVYQPGGGPQPSNFELHRMLKAWNEGDKDSTFEASPGAGFPASTNEATWNSPFAFSTNTWTFPGASNDFAAAVSSSSYIYGVGDSPYLFNSTAQLIDDIQFWVNNPADNFGWLLKTEDETIPYTARRFGSREFAGEDPFSPPMLEVEFVSAPVISDVRVDNGQFHFSFNAEADQNYSVQFQTALATNGWTTLTNIPAAGDAANVTISDSLSGAAKFYRVIAE